jgi:hypothetical protein
MAIYQRHWCEHKPSVTINVRSEEWFEVGAFVYKHFDEMSGVSFTGLDYQSMRLRIHPKVLARLLVQVDHVRLWI